MERYWICRADFADKEINKMQNSSNFTRNQSFPTAALII